MSRSIVLDLDGVIADIAASLDKWVEDAHGDSSDNIDYSSWLITNNNCKEAMDIFNNPLFWKNMKPYSDAWHCINYWFGSGDDIYIVTARRCQSAIEQTVPWLDMWGISTMMPIFTNINEKHNVIEEINPEFVVEDNPHEVKILREHGINALLRKQWYNRQFWNELPTINSLWDMERNN